MSGTKLGVAAYLFVALALVSCAAAQKRSSVDVAALRTAADTLHASGLAMDPNRLNTALRILQSELDLAESRLTLADNADMLADLYEILGPGGTDVDATAMVSFNQRLHERVKRGRQVAA